jgi:hypothetical protein
VPIRESDGSRQKFIPSPQLKYIHMLVPWAASCAIGDKAWWRCLYLGRLSNCAHVRADCYKEPGLLHINLSLNSILCKMRPPGHFSQRRTSTSAAVFPLLPILGMEDKHPAFAITCTHMDVGRKVAFWGIVCFGVAPFFRNTHRR